MSYALKISKPQKYLYPLMGFRLCCAPASVWDRKILNLIVKDDNDEF